jgi:iron(III) transport system substrate-binding protein
MIIKRAVFVLGAVLAFGALAYCPAVSNAQSDSFSQLVAASKAEVEKKSGKLSVALTWTDPQVKPVLAAFQKEFPVVKEVSYTRVRTIPVAQRMLMEYKAGRPPDIDISYISNELWPTYKQAGAFVKPRFSYAELVKKLPRGWPTPDPRAMDPEGYYMAGTGSGRGIAYNKNLIPADKAPKSWEDCTDPKWKGKVLYDTRARLTAFQHDPKHREWFLKWIEKLVANGVVLNRGMGENLEKVVAGEFPISCVANYHNAMPMIDEGAPLVFFFPDPYTLDIATELHVLKWSKTPATTQLFALWLATKAQPLIEKHSYRGFPWVPESRKYAMAKGKEMVLCADDCRSKGDEYNEEQAKILRLPGSK